MQRSSRADIEQEFGAPGVENPMLLDLIARDPADDRVVLTMIERRPWGLADGAALARQFAQIEEKINRYLGYVLDGFLAEHYPQYVGKQVRIRLRCAEPPAGEAARFVAAAEQAITRYGIGFEVRVGVADSAS